MQQARVPDRREVVMEHIASRKGWGAYIDAMTKVRRSVATEANEFLADIRHRLDEALQSNGKEREVSRTRGVRE